MDYRGETKDLPATTNAGETAENDPRTSGARMFIRLVPNVANSAGLLGHGNDDGNANDWDDDGLENEEPLKLVRRDQQDGKLDAPKDEVSDQLVRSQAGSREERVRNVPE